MSRSKFYLVFSHVGQISVYVIFSETSSFIKVDGKYCETHYGEETTLEKATEKCQNDEDCMLFYSQSCKVEGPFKLCQNQSDLQEVNSTTCAYLKKQGRNNFDLDYVRLYYSNFKPYSRSSFK